MTYNDEIIFEQERTCDNCHTAAPLVEFNAALVCEVCFDEFADREYERFLKENRV